MRRPLWRRCVAATACAVFALSVAASGSPAAGEAASGAAMARPETVGGASGPALASAAAAAASRPSGGSWSEMQRRFKGAFVLSASRQSRRVALTFDDVPDPRFTPLVLNALKKEGVRATFFVVGSRALRHPGLVKRIHREGHAIGNHSYDHPDFSRLTLREMRSQIRRTEDALAGEVGFAPKLIRPPYGEIKLTQLRWAQKSGYTVVNWDVDSSDWRQLSSSAVYANVTRAVRPGSIILLHAGGGAGQNLYGTVKAIPRLVLWLRMHDYEPVTLPELLGVPEH